MADPLSADHVAAQAGGFEPQRQSNWEFEVALGGGDRDVIKLSARSMDLPRGTNEEVQLPYGNENRYVAGKMTWDATSLTLADYVDQDTRAAILRWRREVYNPDTGNLGLAKDYKKDATLTLYGPNGQMERQCKLTGCWPTTEPGGSLDHSSSDAVMIEVPIRFDKAIWLL
jgi:hypothetical protein